MIRKKLEFKEDSKSSSIDISISQISKKNLKNSIDSKESDEYNNKQIHNIQKVTINAQIRGRQLNDKLFTISKKNNSSLATTCESKKRIGNKSKY